MRWVAVCGPRSQRGGGPDVSPAPRCVRAFIKYQDVQQAIVKVTHVCWPWCLDGGSNPLNQTGRGPASLPTAGEDRFISLSSAVVVVMETGGAGACWFGNTVSQQAPPPVAPPPAQGGAVLVLGGRRRGRRLSGGSGSGCRCQG